MAGIVSMEQVLCDADEPGLTYRRGVRRYILGERGLGGEVVSRGRMGS